MNIFYIYSYSINDKIFYIGKGFGNRIYAHFHKSNLLLDRKFYKKLRTLLIQGKWPEIKKLHENLTKDEADILEQQLIKELNPECNIVKNIIKFKNEVQLKYISKEIEITEEFKESLITFVQENTKMKYVRQQMLRMINHHPELYQEFLELTDTETNDIALEKLYYNKIHESDFYQEKYNSLAVIKKEIMITGDSSLVAEIRKMVKRHGWLAFITAIRDFAASKKKELATSGLQYRAEEWEGIENRISKVRKNVMN